MDKGTIENLVVGSILVLKEQHIPDGYYKVLPAGTTVTIKSIIANGFIIKVDDKEVFYNKADLIKFFDISLKETLKAYLKNKNISELVELLKQSENDKEDRDIGYYRGQIEILGNLKNLLESFE